MDNLIKYTPRLVEVAGSLKAALLLSYFSQKTHENEGNCTITNFESLQNDLGFSKAELSTALKKISKRINQNSIIKENFFIYYRTDVNKKTTFWFNEKYFIAKYRDLIEPIVFKNPLIKLINFKNFDISKLDEKSGLYFLYNSQRCLVYVGMSKNLNSRVLTSITKKKRIKDIKYVRFMESSLSDAYVLEAYYITKFKPILNKNMNTSDCLTIEIKHNKKYTNLIEIL